LNASGASFNHTFRASAGRSSGASNSSISAIAVLLFVVGTPVRIGRAAVDRP
jgi:hypothetical protein